VFELVRTRVERANKERGTLRTTTNLQKLEDVVPDIEVGEGRVELLEIHVVDVLEDDGGSFGLR